MRLLSPRLRAQIVKELLCVLRDPRSRIAMIAPPLMQLLIFSFAATLEVRNVTLAVRDRDGGKAAYELTARLGSAAFVRQLRTVHDPAELRGLIERREVLAAVDIPEGFSRDLAAGRPAKAQVLLDGRRANAGQVLLGYLNAIAAGIGAQVAPVEPAAVRHAFNPNQIYRWFVVPNIGGILIMFLTLISTAMSIARERELGTFDQLLVSPCTPMEIIAAKMAPALILSVIMGSLMAAIAVFLFGVPFTGSFPLLLASLLVFVLANVGIGLMISSACATQQQAILGAFAVGVPMVLMSGFATPVENMPAFFQSLAQLIPMRYYLVILQGTFLKAIPPALVLANLWPMALIAAVNLTLATLLVRSKLS